MQGIGVPIAADRRFVYTDDFYHLGQRLIRTGKRRRRLRKGACSGPVSTIHLVPGRVLFVCEYLQSEESLVVGPGESVPGSTTPDAILVAVDPGSGKQVWKREGAIHAPLASAGGRLFLTSADELLAVEAVTGRQRWKSPLGDQATIGPTAGKGRVFVQTADGRVRAYGAGDGKMLWKRGLPGEAHSPMATDGDRLFVARSLSADPDVSHARMFALDAATGKTVWQHDLPGQAVFFPATTARDTVLLATMGAGDRPGQLHALEAGGGEPRWVRPVATDANGHDFTPAVDRDRVLIWSGDLDELRTQAGSTSYHLAAFDLADGRPLWRFWPRLSDKHVLSRPLVRGRLLLYADGSHLHAVRLDIRATGAPPPNPDR
jgi:outer membrane protein assembly factor BamB